jgi:phospholipid/cholesterol/gamma-HCH transport system permease protein
MIAILTKLGQSVLDPLARMGRANLFFLRLLCALPFLFRRPGLLVKQLYTVGVLSLPIILVSGLFVGMVLGLQGYANLVDFGAASSLGTVVALSLIRELGPVLTALRRSSRFSANRWDRINESN